MNGEKLQEELEVIENEIKDLQKQIEEIVKKQVELFKKMIKQSDPIIEFIKNNTYFTSRDQRIRFKTRVGPIIAYDEKNDEYFVYKPTAKDTVEVYSNYNGEHVKNICLNDLFERGFAKQIFESIDHLKGIPTKMLEAHREYVRDGLKLIEKYSDQAP